MSFVIEYHVLWLQVPINDVTFMEVFQRQQYLAQIHATFFLREATLSVQDLTQIRPRTKVQYKEEFGLRLKRCV